MTRRRNGYALLWAAMALVSAGLTLWTLASGGNPWVVAILALYVGWDLHAMVVELRR